MNNFTLIHSGGKAVGRVEGHIFTKRVIGSRHFLRVPRAIALDIASLDESENAGATHVAITDTETGCIYQASISFIREHGFRLNRGFGEQIALPIAKWQSKGEPFQSTSNFIQA